MTPKQFAIKVASQIERSGDTPISFAGQQFIEEAIIAARSQMQKEIEEAKAEEEVNHLEAEIEIVVKMPAKNRQRILINVL